MKRVATINDLSGFGKCSLVADIAVLSAMGVAACPLPTAVYTAQTGFPQYHCEDLTEATPEFTAHWDRLGATFDGILTGFLLNERQADATLAFVERFHMDETILLVDPVMADHGQYYANFSEGLLKKMIALTGEADAITPNVSELCLLTGAKMDETLTLKDDALIERLTALAQKLRDGGKRRMRVIVTGVPAEEKTKQTKPARKIGNLIVDEDGARLSTFPAIDIAFSGTGDLFAAAVIGGLVRGDAPDDCVTRAGNFISMAARDAAQEGAPPREGTLYERRLSLLFSTDENKL